MVQIFLDIKSNPELLVPVFVQGIRTVLIVEIHRVYRRHHACRIERVGIVGAVGLGLIVVILRRARKVEAGAEPFVGLEVRRDTAGETLKIVVFDVAVLGKVGKRSEDIVIILPLRHRTLNDVPASIGNSWRIKCCKTSGKDFHIGISPRNWC